MYCLLLGSALIGNSGLCNPDPEALKNLVPAVSEVCIKDCDAPTQGPTSYQLDESRDDLGEEGYSITCGPEKRIVTAKTKAGLFYGKKTLEQMEHLNNVPCCEIIDKPAMKMRSVMLDLARLKEKHEYYYHIIDLLAQWKINYVFLHLTDHSGCAIEIERYPSLATKYAFTQEEMKKLIKYAEERHIELIPEMEPWGHAMYITSRPEFADLAEDPDNPKALCTSNPRTFEVVEGIIEELAALFPSKYFHAGCDEAAFGKCPKCKARAEEIGVGGLAGEHVAKVCEIVKSKGKVPMVWSDIIIHYRDSVKMIPKDVIMCDWHYDAKVDPEPTQFLKNEGYTVVGCPAIVQGSRMILPMWDAFDNCESFAGIVLDQGLLGMETTVWVPQRYIADTIYMPLAYACELSWSGKKRSKLEFAQAFANYFYGLMPLEEVGQTLLDAHDLSIKDFDYVGNVPVYVQMMLEKPENKLPKNDAELISKATAIAQALRTLKPNVTRHETEFDAIILAADTSLHIRQRTAMLHNAIRSIRNAEKSAESGSTLAAASIVEKTANEVESIRNQEKTIISRLDSAWDRWRYADDPYKREGGQNLQEGFQKSIKFLDALVPKLNTIAAQLSQGEAVDWDSVFNVVKEKKAAFVDAGDVDAHAQS